MKDSEEVETVRMNAVRLNSGHLLPAVGLGVYRSAAGGECYQAVLSALKLGYRHIDTAQIYGNEGDVGRWVSGQALCMVFGRAHQLAGSGSEVALYGAAKWQAALLPTAKTPSMRVLAHCASSPPRCRALADSGVPREEVWVTTKLWTSNWGYDTARAGIRWVGSCAGEPGTLWDEAFGHARCALRLPSL